MDSDLKFKMQPAWIITIDIFAAPFAYVLYGALVDIQFDLTLIPASVILLVFAFFLIPLNIKMISGIPAITLTEDCLVDNISGRSIPWRNISDINVVTGFYKSFDKIAINLKHPEEYFDTPWRRGLYKFRQLFVTNDISIIADFISGSSDEIVATIRAYWDKSADL